MSLIVKKFGGTSVADIKNIKNVAQIIKNSIEDGEQVVAVVSAMAGVTNELISKCYSVSDLITAEQMREYDAVVSSGEIITSSLLALELNSLGIKAKSLQGWQVPVQTNSDASDALVKNIPTQKIEDLVKEGCVPVITGFQGIAGEDITTLGKGGSDTSAALIAAALKAQRCDIYTDVDGVFTADPGVVDSARKIQRLEPELMLRLSELGAKVLHPRAAQAAVRYNLDMRILSSFNKVEGTIIAKDRYNIMEDGVVKAITGDSNKLIVKITLHEAATCNQILEQLHAAKLDYQSIEIAANSEVTLQAKLTDKNKYNKYLADLQKQQLISDYNFNSDVAAVSLIGHGINNRASFDDDGNLSNIKGKVLQILAQNNIAFYSISCCSMDMTITIDDNNLEKAKRALHVFVKV